MKLWRSNFRCEIVTILFSTPLFVRDITFNCLESSCASAAASASPLPSLRTVRYFESELLKCLDSSPFGGEVGNFLPPKIKLLINLWRDGRAARVDDDVKVTNDSIKLGCRKWFSSVFNNSWKFSASRKLIWHLPFSIRMSSRFVFFCLSCGWASERALGTIFLVVFVFNFSTLNFSCCYRTSRN